MEVLPVVGIVVPCFNEEEVILETSLRLSGIIETLVYENKIKDESFILFVDDGSTDDTWKIIMDLNKDNKCIKGIKLSRNFGHQNALLAGLLRCKESTDCSISIDADLQQDEKAIFEFIEKYREGYNIVFGVRNNRSTDRIFKKCTALFFYKLMQILGVSIIKNHADYRLLDKKAMDALSQYTEVNLFLRGTFSLLGYKTAIVYHDVRERFAGESKYSLKKMLAFALNGVTSFSIIPIRLITGIGFLLFIFSLIMIVYAFVSFVKGITILGWASTVIPIYFIGGLQLVGLGLVGEYIGKIYMEVKGRPRYIIDEEKF